MDIKRIKMILREDIKYVLQGENPKEVINELKKQDYFCELSYDGKTIKLIGYIEPC